MTTHERAIAKIQKLPEPLVSEVADFIDFLLLKNDAARWEMLNELSEAQALAETGMGDYGANLSVYEDSLARGEIQW